MDRKQASVFPARIRMRELVWRFIVETNTTDDTKDPLQEHIVRLIHGNPLAKERILVTDDDELLDCLRDWCARMITQSRLSVVRPGVSPADLAKEAGHVVDLIDRYDSKILELRGALK